MDVAARNVMSLLLLLLLLPPLLLLLLLLLLSLSLSLTSTDPLCPLPPSLHIRSQHRAAGHAAVVAMPVKKYNNLQV